MPRWLLWTPLVALTAVACLTGLRAGWLYSTMTETDVITAAAKAYVSGGQGRQASDCAAQPAPEKAVWLTVTCLEPNGHPHVFEANPLGQVTAKASFKGPST